MRREPKNIKEEGTFEFIDSSRNILSIFVVFGFSLACLLPSSRIWAEEPVAISKLYSAKKYKDVVLALEAKELGGKPLEYKDFVYLITSYQKLNDLDKKISTLKRASLKFPKKDVFKRELSKALEVKSNSYVDTKAYAVIKKNLKAESMKILNDLYDVSRTKENFTALITYFNREKNFAEAIGLLEMYGRTSPKGRIYYTYLCEAQYHSKLYDTSASTCAKLINSFPSSEKGHLYYGKSLEKIGEKETAKKAFLSVASRFPASSQIQLEAGKALISEGRTGEGLSHLDKHLELEQTDEALVLKAGTLFELKQFEKALEVYIEACKQHQEPRKPLISKLKAASKTFQYKSDLQTKYEKEVRRCLYVYRPEKKAPKGLLGGGYGNK